MIVLSIVLLAIIATGMTFMLSSGSKWTTRERKEWKDTAITTIEAQISAVPSTMPADGAWATGDRLMMKNDEWILCQSISIKQNPLIDDLFIGYGSDGDWYFSTFPFDVNRSVLQKDARPESLREFVQRYALRPFDGRSDMALQPTWTAARP